MPAPRPNKFENKRAFMRRCMGSTSVLNRANTVTRDAEIRANREGATMLTGDLPDFMEARRELCEMLWSKQQKRFATPDETGKRGEDEAQAGSGGFVAEGYVAPGYVG